MTRIFVITVAYCRSAQLARCLLEFVNTIPVLNYGGIEVSHHIVQGWYPIDTTRNNQEIKLIAESYGDGEFLATLWDPGADLGSAQSQQWLLNQLNTGPSDLWINLDPDSACRSNWIPDARTVLASDPECQVISCMSPMVEKILKERDQKLIVKKVNHVRIGIPQQPTPFNLSMFRCSFVKEMGGLRQLFPSWGELEAVIYHEATMRGKYHAYLLDHMEDENGKFFHPTNNAEWKDLHARTVGEKQFLGSYGEFLAYYYPQIANLKL